MQTQPVTTTTITAGENNAIINMPSGFSVPSNYTASIDNSVKNEQEMMSIRSITEPNTQTQIANQFNPADAGCYIPTSSVSQMFSNQPTMSYTSSKQLISIYILLMLIN